MGTSSVVVEAPGLDVMPSIAKAGKPELVQTLVSESAVEALDVGILDRPARANEVQAHAILMSPKVKGLACEFRPVIDHDDLGHASLAYETVKNSDHPKAWQRAVYLERETLPAALIHDVEAAKRSPVDQGIADEVHRPTLVEAACPNPRLPLALADALP